VGKAIGRNNKDKKTEDLEPIFKAKLGYISRKSF
jgi:hypothetical protein